MGRKGHEHSKMQQKCYQNKKNFPSNHLTVNTTNAESNEFGDWDVFSLRIDCSTEISLFIFRFLSLSLARSCACFLRQHIKIRLALYLQMRV